MSANVPPVTRWWQYVQGVAKSASRTAIAEAAGVSQPTVTRWAQGTIERPTADVAVRFALSYDASVGDALVAAGVLTEDQLPVTTMRYSRPDDDTLIDLLRERLRSDRGEGEGSAGQPAAKTHAGASPATPTRVDRDRVIASLVDELDGGRTVDDVRSAAAGILAGPGRSDYVLAAQDRDDSEEIEAQQIDP